MQLRNDENGFITLHNLIGDYYQRKGKECFIFDYKYKKNETSEDTDFYIRWLLDKKTVVEYRLFTDRGLVGSVVKIAIGPAYFDAYQFWDYDNASRFNLDANTEAVLHNLKLLDEFLI